MKHVLLEDNEWMLLCEISKDQFSMSDPFHHRIYEKLVQAPTKLDERWAMWALWFSILALIISMLSSMCQFTWMENHDALRSDTSLQQLPVQDRRSPVHPPSQRNRSRSDARDIRVSQDGPCKTEERCEWTLREEASLALRGTLDYYGEATTSWRHAADRRATRLV
jgi:hypothetical protein